MHYTQGHCAADEICVGSEAGDGRTPLQAHCVSTTHFVNIGRNTSSGSYQNPGSSGVVTAGFNPTLRNTNGSHIAVEAIVTAVNKRESLFATSVVIQGQKINGISRTEPNGYSNCLGCSSLSLAPFPVNARKVKVDVVLPESMPAGLLWLASYLYDDDRD